MHKLVTTLAGLAIALIVIGLVASHFLGNGSSAC